MTTRAETGLDGRPTPYGFLEVESQDVAAQGSEVLLVDVREQEEWMGELGHIAGAVLLPLSQWPTLAAQVDTSRPVVTVCRSGKRSAQAAALLVQQGAKRVYSLRGGMMEWSRAGLPVKRGT
jgi:rhodanese-related sulfurtransferase